MQAFFLKIYTQIKQRLCERRNNRQLINPYAALQQTAISIKRPQQNAILQNQIISLNNLELKSKQQRLSKQIKDHNQQQNQQNQYKNTKTMKRQSIYQIDFKDDDSESNQTMEEQICHQQLIRSSVRISLHHHQLTQNYEKIASIFEQDNQRKINFWRNIYQKHSNEPLSRDISQIISQNQQNLREQMSKRTLQLDYQSDIAQLRDFKYSKELVFDYPQISLETYSRIRNYWTLAKRYPNQTIKTLKLKILEKLTYRSLRTLSFGVWLNDQIINSYLQMIQNKSFEVGKQYKILNSFFAQTTFAKSNELIERALRRKKVNENSIIIIAINNGNHWFFAKIRHSKVIIYDSIVKSSPQYYLQSESSREIFQNILRFANWYYHSEHSLQIDSNYPQQRNSFDCGMFLLCGIKDIVREYDNWSFSQDDIKYKRIQVANQLLNQKISGFQI